MTDDFEQFITLTCDCTTVPPDVLLYTCVPLFWGSAAPYLFYFFYQSNNYLKYIYIHL